ncbi:MAG: hypothetical protein C4289_01315, partial [Chloroflexota bacterium]
MARRRLADHAARCGWELPCGGDGRRACPGISPRWHPARRGDTARHRTFAGLRSAGAPPACPRCRAEADGVGPARLDAASCAPLLPHPLARSAHHRQALPRTRGCQKIGPGGVSLSSEARFTQHVPERLVQQVDVPAQREADPAGRFEDLFMQLYPSLYNLAYRVLGEREEAEDVLQESFLRLDGAAVLRRPDEEVAAWLRRVCLNLAFNRLRDRRRARERLERAGRLDA